jgi:acetyltransferase-like isoleucine patch superfamily enzyme
MEEDPKFRAIIGAFEDALGFIKDNPRNAALRDQIYTYVSSQILTDDERAARLGLPEGCRIRENAKIISIENFKCGKYTWIGEGAILDASGGLEIGEHTSVGLYVLVWSHSSYLGNTKMNNINNSPFITRSSTRIGSGCFIAGHSVIYPGVTVRDRTVILPMSTITKDTPGNCIVAGSPAKVIRELRPDEM